MFHILCRDLQNITKDLTILNENLIKVKMGHALFPMLESEEKEQGTIYQQERSLALRSLKDGKINVKTFSLWLLTVMYPYPGNSWWMYHSGGCSALWIEEFCIKIIPNFLHYWLV